MAAGDPDPDGPFSGPIWQEGGPQIAPTGNLAALLGLQMPSPFIIDNWTTDQNGNVIGQKPGEQLCDTGGINCQNLYWNTALGEWDFPTYLQHQGTGIRQLAEAQHSLEAPLLFALPLAGSASVIGGFGFLDFVACTQPGAVFTCGPALAVTIPGAWALLYFDYQYLKNAPSIWRNINAH